ncbi:MAG: outer membrane beta-barrel protein [Bacteroidota bacterium]
MRNTEPFTRLWKYTWKNNLSVIFLFLSFSSWSQENRVFTLGAVAGLNTSQISGDNLAGFDQIGLYAGAYTNIYVSEKLQFQIETCFSQKGSRRNAKPDKGQYYNYFLRLNYIDIPVFARFRTRNFIGEIGPCFSYLVSYYEEENYNPINFRSFKPFEISGFLGLGYQLVPEKLVFSVRINNSFLPVRDHLFGSTFRLNRGQYNAVLNFVFQAHLFGKK